MGIDAARNHVLAGGIYGLGIVRRQINPDGAYFPIVHQDVGHVVVHCSEDVPVLDQDAHYSLHTVG